MSLHETRTVNKGVSALAVLAVIGLAMAAFMPFVSADDEPEYDEDLGDFWGTELRFVYAPPSDSPVADTVTWDFGDDSEEETGMFVDHVFTPGIYYVTQTATNEAGSTTAVYKIRVCGPPTVTYDLNCDGAEPVVITQERAKIAPGAIDDPTREGFEFSGWYTDRNCTRAADMTATIDIPTTFYAKWTRAAVAPVSTHVTLIIGDDTVEEDVTDTDTLMTLVAKDGSDVRFYVDEECTEEWDGELDGTPLTLYVQYEEAKKTVTSEHALIGIAVAGILCMLAFAVTRKPVLLAVGAVFLSVAALFHFGVIEWPL